MAIILTYGKGNNNTSTMPVTGLTISVGFYVGVIVFITGSADETGHGSCVDSSGSNTYTQRGTTFFRAGFGWTSECFTAANVGASATSVTWTPPTIGTNFGMSAAVWVLNPNTGIITYADVKQADVTSTVTTTNGVATANIATTTANSLIVAMGTDTQSSTLSAGTAMSADTVPTAGVIPEHQFVSAATPAQWTDSTAAHYAIFAGLGFDWTATATPFTPFTKTHFFVTDTTVQM